MRPVALVTGGAKRVGAQIAEYLAARGYDIALHYNSSKGHAMETAKYIRDKGASCETFLADLGDDDELGRLVPKVKSMMGGLDLLVNNAAAFESATLVGTEAALFDRQMRVNLRAPYLLIRDFARSFEKGHVINVLDAKIKQDKTSYFAYILSKRALADLTRMSATELAPRIRVNGVAPGLIMPPDGKEGSYLEDLAKRTGLRRGKVSDVTDAIGVLLDDEAATGRIVYI
jgi:NAD(P)-dependent dehydrogenase (short-subunit alcohol dehydrogenase family)